jgi:hypothetical protein
MISLREASIFIKNNILTPSKLLNNNTRIFLLNNLSIEDEWVKTSNLEAALVSAKFLSGVENYSVEEQQYLLEIFIASLKKNPNWKKDYLELASAILRKKRVYYKKFFGSTLEKIVTMIKN